MKIEEKEFLPYGRHHVIDSDIQNVVEVLKNKNLTQGNITDNFEMSISKKVESKFCVSVNSATSALHLACLAMGLKNKDILWTSPNSFVASANCGVYCGAEIDFVDIDPLTGLMCMKKLREKLENANLQNKLPKIIIPVHLTGSVCDMETLYNLSLKYKFSIIEDASHAIGAKYKNKFVGNCQYSDLAVFSFHPVKIITCGEGGCITTNKENLFNSIVKLRSHGITKNKEEFVMPAPGDWSYEQQVLGFNYRLSDIHAALGLSQLERLDEIVYERNRQFMFYEELLDNLPLKLLSIPKDVKSSVHLAVIRLCNEDPVFHKYIFDGMRKSNIGVQIHYTPIHLHPFYRRKGFQEGDFPEAEFYAKNAISIPLYINLSETQQIRVVNTLREILN